MATSDVNKQYIGIPEYGRPNVLKPNPNNRNALYALGSPMSSLANSTSSKKSIDQLTPDELATLLGQSGYTPGYNPNQKGSYEGAFNNLLGGLNPQQLISRYSQGSQSQYQTPLDQQQAQAYQTFKSLFGRDPNQNEFAQVLPAFQGPNGLTNGRAFLANLQMQYKANPTLDPTNAQNNQNPADVSSSVAQQFKSILGRDPTSDELAHFTQAIQTNQTDAYGLSSFLKQQPEYTNAQDKTFREGLNTELQNYDTTEFGREKNDVMAAYARNGIAPGSSPSLDYALTDLMGKISENRSKYLAGISANQYQGNKDLAIGGYKNTLDQMYNNNQNQRQGQTAYGQQLLNQGFQGADYQTQMRDYMNYLGSQPQRKPNAFDYLNTGAQLAGGIGSLVSAFR